MVVLPALRARNAMVLPMHDLSIKKVVVVVHKPETVPRAAAVKKDAVAAGIVVMFRVV